MRNEGGKTAGQGLRGKKEGGVFVWTILPSWVTCQMITPMRYLHYSATSVHVK